MRVWQPGSHLTMQRGAEVDDWSWRRTRRRLATLARLTAPYRTRTIFSIFSLLLATATALAPPLLAKYAIDGVTTLVQSTLTLIGTAILLFVLDWRLALATLAVIPIMSVGTILFRIHSSRAYAAVRERLGLVTATLAEDIAGMRIVQAFTRERTNMRNFREVSERYRDSNMETVVLNGLYFPFVDLLSSVALAVVLGYGGHLYFQGSLTLGTLFAFMLYVQNFFDPVQQLSQLYGTFLSATAALDKIMDVLDEEPEVLDKPAAEPLPHVEGRVDFDHVRFGYGEGPEVLHDLDLDVP